MSHLAIKYEKLPVVIEAIQFYPEQGEEVAEWCGGVYAFKANFKDGTSEVIDVTYWIAITTLEGVMHAKPGDFIIKGVQGEFYPCKEDIFYATYQLAPKEE